VTIERIFTRGGDGKPQLEHTRVRVVAGEGIEGDRYFGRAEEPGQNVTFIEAEEIEAFLGALGRPVDLALTGRNIVTRGIRLNDLVGKEFVVGAVRFRGVELCEPCTGLGHAMAAPDLTPAQVVKRMVHRAGLRADALSTGEIACGARLEPVTEHVQDVSS
jgi:MOSC domain-containing protein YiiM